MTDTTPRTLARYLLVGAVLALASVLLPHVAVAASAGGGAPMPWTGPLQSLLNNLSGPTARIIGALASWWAGRCGRSRVTRRGRAASRRRWSASPS